MLKKLKSTFGPYRYALDMVWQSSKRWTIARLVLIFFQAALPLASLYLMKLVIDQLTTNINEPGAIDEIIYLLIAFGVVTLGQMACTSVSQYVNEMQMQKVSDFVASRMQEKSIAMDLEVYEDDEYYNSYYQAQRHGRNRPAQLVAGLMDFLQNVIGLVFIGGFILYLHYIIALLLLVAVLPSAIIKYRFSQKLYEWEKKRVALEREGHYLNRLMTEPEFVKEVRLFDAGIPLKDKFKNIRDRLFKEKKALNSFRLRINLAGQTLEVSAEVLSYVLIAYRAFNRIITIGDLVIYFQAFQKGKSNLSKALQAMVKLMEHRMFLSYLIDFMSTEPKIVDTEEAKSFEGAIESGINLSGVSFQYPKSEVNAVEDINLSFEKGKLHALVGENGSGKSTLVKLIARLYDPSNGALTLDGKAYSELKIRDLRGKMSVTYQDFARYFLSLEQNISFSALDGEVSRSKITSAAAFSGVDKFLDDLPRGYDQRLGKQFMGGVELSLGQWQKVALSRMLYKDSEVLILDEPTSAIDPLAEHDIFSNLKQLAKDRIVILVTHRLYNLKLADQIVVMDSGRVIEQGDHDTLYAANGKYRLMFERQQ